MSQLYKIIVFFRLTKKEDETLWYMLRRGVFRGESVTGYNNFITKSIPSILMEFILCYFLSFVVI